MFQINTESLPPSEAFPYLEHMIAYNNIDWVAVYLNLRKSWRRWVIIARVLERTGAMVWAWEQFTRRWRSRCYYMIEISGW